MSNIIRFPAAPPAVSRDQQQNIDTDRLRAMAIVIGTHGDLRRHVPKQPRWYRTIGDEIGAMLQQGEPVNPINIERLISVFDAAQSNESIAVLKREPKPGQALSLRRTISANGIRRLEVEVVSLRRATLAPTAGAA